jgi:hypothetical protein
MPVILATQEAVISRIAVQSQPATKKRSGGIMQVIRVPE